MSRSSFSKAYKEIANLNPMEMTFTIEDADSDKLYDLLKDINVKECPWFEVQDKHGNKARYYREPHWIPLSEKFPQKDEDVLLQFPSNQGVGYYEDGDWMINTGDGIYSIIGYNEEKPIAWMPLPEPYGGEQE